VPQSLVSAFGVLSDRWVSDLNKAPEVHKRFLNPQKHAQNSLYFDAEVIYVI
jgi:hypothetical protein